MIDKIRRFMYFTFIDLVRFKPLMLRSTYEKEVAEISKRHANIANSYWKRAALTTDWEFKYRELLQKTQSDKVKT